MDQRATLLACYRLSLERQPIHPTRRNTTIACPAR